MCGIVGIFNLDTAPVSPGLAERMIQVIKHRGPDDEGYFLANSREGSYELAGGRDTPEAVWTSQNPFSPRRKLDSISASRGFDLVFGHRRLAIFDLSAAGHQPMCNEDGTIWITYNGEIYNYIELRAELISRGHTFNSNTDTEVVIHAYEEWGYDCLKKFNGEWAFALWDMKIHKLFCSRDRFGIKPFYYYFNGEIFVFASEIKALLEHPEVPRKANEEPIYTYLLWGLLGYSDETLFEGIKELKSSHYLLVDTKDGLNVKKWWSLEINPSLGDFSTDNVDDTVRQFLTLLEDSVRLRFRGDVPVSSFLSGGLDTSSIVCLAHRLLTNNSIPDRQIGEELRTFSACYEDESCDERRFIEPVLKKTRAQKNYVFPDGDELWKELPLLVWHQDEPFMGTNLYSWWTAIKKASTIGVKVLLDGQGGDEILAGYHHYYGIFLLNIAFKGRLCGLLRESKGIAANIGTQNLISMTSRPLGMALFGTLPTSTQTTARNVIRRLRCRKVDEILNASFNKKVGTQALATLMEYSKTGTNLQKTLYRDVSRHLHNLLRYGDRDSMAFSIETRAPFLDHRVVEYLFSLPASLKIRDGWTKWILRQAMKGILPEEIRLRKDKLGTPTPQAAWLWQNRGAIKALFTSGDTMSSDYVNPKAVTNYLDDIFARKASTWELWHYINLELWFRAFFAPKAK